MNKCRGPGGEKNHTYGKQDLTFARFWVKRQRHSEKKTGRKVPPPSWHVFRKKTYMRHINQLEGVRSSMVNYGVARSLYRSLSCSLEI